MLFKNLPDSDQIASWIKRHINKIIIVVGMCISAGLANVIWLNWNQKQQYHVYDDLHKSQSALYKLLNKQNIKTDKSSFKNKKPIVKLPLSEAIKTLAQAHKNHIQKYKKHKITTAFAIDLAEFYYKHKEQDKAMQVLSPFALASRSSTMYHLASLQLATYYTNSKQCEQALKLLSQLNLNLEARAFYTESLLQQALCLENLKRYEQALHKYELILKTDPNSYTARLAKDYKMLLHLHQKQKKSKAKIN